MQDYSTIIIAFIAGTLPTAAAYLVSWKRSRVGLNTDRDAQITKWYDKTILLMDENAAIKTALNKCQDQVSKCKCPELG